MHNRSRPIAPEPTSLALLPIWPHPLPSQFFFLTFYLGLCLWESYLDIHNLAEMPICKYPGSLCLYTKTVSTLDITVYIHAHTHIYTCLFEINSIHGINSCKPLTTLVVFPFSLFIPFFPCYMVIWKLLCASNLFRSELLNRKRKYPF